MTSPLPRAYRVLAESPRGDTMLIVTDSRTRAIRYHALLLGEEGWKEQRVELGPRGYTKDTMEQLP